MIAVKEANPDMGEALEKLRLCGEDATFYCGNDNLIVPAMACGFQGVISVLSNLLPAETSRMAALALSGDYPAAAAMQRSLLPLVDALFSETSRSRSRRRWPPSGCATRSCRLPLVPMQPATREKLYEAMRGAGLRV